MKKFITILLTIIAFIFLVFIGYWIIQGINKKNEILKQEKILRKEVSILYNLDWNNQNVDMRIKSTLEFGKLESIIKNYYNELYQYRKEYDSTNIYNLSTEFLNGKYLKVADLNVSKQKLTNAYEQNKKTAQKIINLTNKDYILSLVKDKEFDDYYINLYKKLITYDDNNLEQKWINQMSADTQIYESTIEALNLLNNNRNAWHIENDKLYFYNENLLGQYNEIIQSIEDTGNFES